MSEAATPNVVTIGEGGLALTFTLTAFLAMADRDGRRTARPQRLGKLVDVKLCDEKLA
jgi:hypothetical protein